MKYTYGLKKGIPIALGYLSVSFGFGISAVEKAFVLSKAFLLLQDMLRKSGDFAKKCVEK